ncbi:lipopolysaccharide biosynthesis protein [Butyrivibrio fibrisolvens]|uniref:lipopolysaccharide biosynthesis protein n=1 Tax=Butyrivibrio fibrisolvens TaxID=831 RepID=UPI000424EFDD|nr:hypothetical protein [Butyrivibrio fibrisolvens]
MNTRTVNSLRNATSGIVNRVVGLLIPFVLRTIVIRVLGSDYLGLNNLFTSILQVLNVADLGFNVAVIYCLYDPLARNSTDEVNCLLNTLRKAYFVIGGVILIIGIMIIPFLPFFINGSYPESINLTIVYVIYLSNTALDYFVYPQYRVLLSAMQKLEITNNISTLVQLILNAIKVIILLKFKNYYFYIIFLPITTFLISIIVAKYSRNKYSQFYCYGNIRSDQKRDIKKRIFALATQKIGNAISLSLDNVVISSIMGLTSVAIYGNYFYVNSALSSFVSVCVLSATASVGNSVVLENKEWNRNTFNKINMINQWLMCWTVPSLLCLYQPFMSMWMGEMYTEDFGFVILMVILYYFISSRKIVLMYKDATGLWWEDRWKPIVGCLINLTLNLSLIRLIGTKGVVISTIISYALVEIPWETKVLFKSYFHEGMTDYYKNMLNYLSLCIITSIASWKICALINNNGIWGMIFKGSVCFIVSNCVFFIICFKNKVFQELKLQLFKTVMGILKR